MHHWDIKSAWQRKFLSKEITWPVLAHLDGQMMSPLTLYMVEHCYLTAARERWLVEQAIIELRRAVARSEPEGRR